MINHQVNSSRFLKQISSSNALVELPPTDCDAKGGMIETIAVGSRLPLAQSWRRNGTCAAVNG
jgi:hypothetical protein